MRVLIATVLAAAVILGAIRPAQADGMANVSDNPKYLRYFPKECQAQWVAGSARFPSVRAWLAKNQPDALKQADSMAAPTFGCILIINYSSPSVTEGEPIHFGLSLPGGGRTFTLPMYLTIVYGQQMGVITHVTPRQSFELNYWVIVPEYRSPITGDIMPHFVMDLGHSPSFTLAPGALMVYWVGR